MIEQAIAAGTHSPTHQSVCDGCGQWTTVVYFADPQNSRRHFCPDCADRLFRQGPRCYALWVQKILSAKAAAREQDAERKWGVQ